MASRARTVNKRSLSPWSKPRHCLGFLIRIFNRILYNSFSQVKLGHDTMDKLNRLEPDENTPGGLQIPGKDKLLYRPQRKSRLGILIQVHSCIIQCIIVCDI